MSLIIYTTLAVSVKECALGKKRQESSDFLRSYRMVINHIMNLFVMWIHVPDLHVFGCRKEYVRKIRLHQHTVQRYALNFYKIKKMRFEV